MKHLSLSASMLIGLIATTGAIASPNVKISGTIPATVQLNQTVTNHSHTLTAAPVLKKISLERIELSEEAKNYLASQADKSTDTTLSTAAAAFTALPPKVSLGMNNVPVLDQGVHGTCATFADTGAIDAARGNTDYISQLCNLELGAYFEKLDKDKGVKYFYHSGWDGTLNEIVLAQIQKYGIVSMRTQREKGCGNSQRVLKEYPLKNKLDQGVPMSVTDFARVSEPIMKDIYSRMILRAENAYTSKTNKEKVLNNVKQALVNGNRVVIGMLLDDKSDELDQVNGATGKYMNVANDSWVISPKIRSDLRAKKINAGHAMIITGYDDNAEIIGSDPKQRHHKGVLTLRNSWSDRAGNKGEYYMSYEYFKLLAMEAAEISPKPLN
jgi:C1A family cysteine protease